MEGFNLPYIRVSFHFLKLHSLHLRDLGTKSIISQGKNRTKENLVLGNPTSYFLRSLTQDRPLLLV